MELHGEEKKNTKASLPRRDPNLGIVDNRRFDMFDTVQNDDPPYGNDENLQANDFSKIVKKKRYKSEKISKSRN